MGAHLKRSQRNACKKKKEKKKRKKEENWVVVQIPKLVPVSNNWRQKEVQAYYLYYDRR